MKQMNKDDFARFINMVGGYTWLKNKEDQLEELWSWCKSDRQKRVMEHVFKNFTFFNHVDDENCFNSFADIISKTWRLSFGDTCFVSMADKGRSDSSLEVLNAVKNYLPGAEGWSEDNFIASVNDLTQTTVFEKYKNIVMVDSFIGSGTKLNKKIQFIKKNYSGKVFYYIAMAGMETHACERLNEFVRAGYLSKYFLYRKLKKGITDYFDQKTGSMYIKSMLAIEKELNLKTEHNPAGVPYSYSLGFKMSEALFGRSPMWTPNNTFPIFWYDKYRTGKPRRAIFRKAR